jgi:hypothetical protein
VAIYPGAFLLVSPSAQDMGVDYSENKKGKPPVVYALHYSVRNGNFEKISAFYMKYDRSGTAVVRGSGEDADLTIRLSPRGQVSQRIVVLAKSIYDCMEGSMSGALPSSCVHIEIVSKGPASWGNPAASAQAATPKPAPIPQPEPQAQAQVASEPAPTKKGCEPKKASKTIASGFGAAIGMLGRGYGASQAVAQGVASDQSEGERRCN